MTTWGTLAAVWSPPTLRFLVEGYSTPNARTAPMVATLRAHLPNALQNTGNGIVFVQYDDHVHNDLCSLGFGRRRGEAPGVTLIPDPFFLGTDTHFLGNKGYDALRTKIRNGGLLPWRERRDVVFWRGSATHNLWTSQGTRVERIDQVPRVILCLLLRNVAGTDAGIVNPWSTFPVDATRRWLEAEGIFRPYASADEQAQHRYLVDIDGVANAWGLYEKLLIGSCILKVESPFEQWFYDSIAPWKHYVPVAADMADLTEKIDWCRNNPADAAAIAATGQAFALGFTYEQGLGVVHNALRKCFTPF